MHMTTIPAARSANSAANNEQRAAAALEAAAAGLRIVILNNADGKPSLRKAPVGKDWGKKATDDEEALLRRFDKRPNANFGVLLGKYPEGSAIPGVIDVEFDCEEGRAAADRIFGKNTFTPTYKSARSVHRLFLWNDNFPPTQVLKIEGLEIRLGGGAKQTQSVLPPSRHSDGTNYRWLPGLSIGEVELAEVPEILAVQFTNVESELEAAGLSGAASAGSLKPDEHWDSIRDGVSEGSRNESLCSLVGKWAFNIVELDADAAADIRERAIAWGERCSPPLPAKECVSVARNIIARDRKRRAEEAGPGSVTTISAGSASQRASIAAPDADGSRPEVLLTTYLGSVTDEVVTRIGKLGWESPWVPERDRERVKVYQRSGKLVQVIRESGDCKTKSGITLPAGTQRIRELPVGQIPLVISNACDLITETRMRSGVKRTSTPPPKWLVDGVFTMGDFGSDIRRLEGVIAAPTLRPDGTIIQEPGYDPQTGLLYTPGDRFPAISADATPEMARQAARELLEVVVDFEFSADADRSAWLALVLSQIGRQAIAGCVPMFAITATTPGSGKGLLADAASMIVFGRVAARKAYSESDEEQRKAITAVATEALPAVLFDNVHHVIGSQSLDAALTASTWSDRILGSSRTTGDLPLRTVWTATGNNLRFGADVARRVLPIRLKPSIENPEQRTGFIHDDLLGWVRENRPRLAVAALTMLRAYYVAGRPEQPGWAWGSFGEWSALIRGAIVWSGLPDPLNTREAAKSDDASSAIVRGLIGGLIEIDECGDGMTAREIVAVLGDLSNAERFNTLREVANEVASHRGVIDAKKLGYAFRQHRGRIANGWAIAGTADRNGVTRWYAERVSAGDAGDRKTDPPQVSPAGFAREKTSNSLSAGDAGDTFEPICVGGVI